MEDGGRWGGLKDAGGGGGWRSVGGWRGKDEAIGWVLMWKGCMSVNASVAAAIMTYIPNK